MKNLEVPGIEPGSMPIFACFLTRVQSIRLLARPYSGNYDLAMTGMSTPLLLQMVLLRLHVYTYIMYIVYVVGLLFHCYICSSCYTCILNPLSGVHRAVDAGFSQSARWILIAYIVYCVYSGSRLAVCVCVCVCVC